MKEPEEKEIGKDKKGVTYEETAPVVAKWSKASCSSGEDSPAVGSASLDAPESSSSFLFLLRPSREVAGGGETE
jgi:hypothetical protein